MNGIATQFDYDYASYSNSYSYSDDYGSEGYGSESEDVRSLNDYASYYGGYGNSYSGNTEIFISSNEICDSCWISILVLPTGDGCQYSIVATLADVPVSLQGESSALPLASL